MKFSEKQMYKYAARRGCFTPSALLKSIFDRGALPPGPPTGPLPLAPAGDLGGPHTPGLLYFGFSLLLLKLGKTLGINLSSYLLKTAILLKSKIKYKWGSIYCKWPTTIVCIHFCQTYLTELSILLNPFSQISDN